MPLSIANTSWRALKGVIEGWANLGQRQVLLTIIMDLPSGANQSIAKDTYTNNVKLTKAYQEIKGAHIDPGEEQKTRPRASSSAKTDHCQCLNGPLGNQRPT